MKMLMDENIDVKISNKLRGKGFSVRTVHEVRKCGALDKELLEIANKENRVFVTCDKDFKARNTHPSKARNGIIYVRLKKPTDFFEVLPRFCNTFTNQRDIASMENKIIEIGKNGYHTTFVDQWGNVQEQHASFGDN